jgi:hypothetical protein
VEERRVSGLVMVQIVCVHDDVRGVALVKPERIILSRKSSRLSSRTRPKCGSRTRQAQTDFDQQCAALDGDIGQQLPQCDVL